MKWWEWVFSGIGVLGLGLLIEWLRRRSHSSRQQSTITAQGAKVSDSPVATGTGITQNSPTIINVALPAAQESEEEKEEKEETAKVDFIQSRIVQLHENGYAIWHEAVSNLQSARPAVVAEFKNKPKAEVGQRTVKAGSVTASLVYRGKGNPEELKEHADET